MTFSEKPYNKKRKACYISRLKKEIEIYNILRMHLEKCLFEFYKKKNFKVSIRESYLAVNALLKYLKENQHINNSLTYYEKRRIFIDDMEIIREVYISSDVCCRKIPKEEVLCFFRISSTFIRYLILICNL